MKGTIMIFLQMKSYPLIALIPVPMEGTMVLLLEIAINSHVLIPVPTEGTIKTGCNEYTGNQRFNPRTHEGYDGEII